MKVITLGFMKKFYNRLGDIFAKKNDVSNATINIKQNGITKGSFTTNQNTDVNINLSGETIVTGLLKQGDTEVELSSEALTEDSIIDVYTDTYGLTPSSITQSNNSVTLTFKPQSSDVNIKVVIR